MKIFYWEEIFNLFLCSVDEIKNSTDSFFLAGTAISVGCFDGPHSGHKFLFSSVLKYAKDNHLKSGLVTFLRPLPSVKYKDEYLGDIATLNQRLNEYEKRRAPVMLKPFSCAPAMHKRYLIDFTVLPSLWQTHVHLSFQAL
mgnify:CR=1 FL=1